ncbi:MAG: alpha/beta fold hydrolase [Planctomycetota bacterium]|nr:alpha/beta fold hydrolase [Planctomycetota bacterium]
MVPRAAIVLTLCVTALTAQEEVRFAASDGQPLSGLYSPPAGTPRGGVLLLHMYRSNRTAWRPIQGRLAASGFHVLALDLRGHGKSSKDAQGESVDVSRDRTEDPKTNPFLKMHLDAKAGIDLLVKRGAPPDRLAVVGASVGCSVALHTAHLHPDAVTAVVLMTPGTAYLGVPSVEHGKTWGDRPALLLSSEEEADRGARPLKAAMTGEDVELRLIPERGIHGTRMFGRVPTVEADIIEWLQAALVTSLELKVPVTKDLFIDGAYEEDEGVGATRIAIPLAAGKNAAVRISRNRKHLVLGFNVPERYLRRNEVLVFVHGGPDEAPAPTPRTFKISFSPVNTERRPLLQWQGTEEGAWKEVPSRDLQAHGKTRERSRWTAEIAIPLSKIVPEDGARTLRLAFQINGQKADQQRFYPPSPAILNVPKAWVLSKVAPL